MKEDSIKKFREYTKQFLLNNKLLLVNEIWNNSYSINEKKGDINDYSIQRFVNEYTLSKEAKSYNYKLWNFIKNQDKSLSEEIVLDYIKYPKYDYERKEYMNNILQIYFKKNSDIDFLKKLFTQKTFLNKNLDIIFENCQTGFLSHEKFANDKKIILDYYINLLKKNNKFNTLENSQKIQILTNNIKNDDKELSINIIERHVVDFKIKTKELVDYSLSLSPILVSNLLNNFLELKNIDQFECKKLIHQKTINSNNDLLEIEFIMFTSLSKEIIEKSFLEYVEQYIKLSEDIGNKIEVQNKKIPESQDVLDCLKFSIIKTRKDLLENKYQEKNIKIKQNKI